MNVKMKCFSNRAMSSLIRSTDGQGFTQGRSLGGVRETVQHMEHFTLSHISLRRVGVIAGVREELRSYAKPGIHLCDYGLSHDLRGVLQQTDAYRKLDCESSISSK